MSSSLILKRAEELFEQGAYAEAKRLYLEVLRDDVSLAVLWSYQTAHDLEQRVVLRQLAERFPDDPHVAMDIATWHTRRGRFETSLEICSAWIDRPAMDVRTQMRFRLERMRAALEGGCGDLLAEDIEWIGETLAHRPAGAKLLGAVAGQLAAARRPHLRAAMVAISQNTRLPEVLRSIAHLKCEELACLEAFTLTIPRNDRGRDRSDLD